MKYLPYILILVIGLVWYFYPNIKIETKYIQGQTQYIKGEVSTITKIKTKILKDTIIISSNDTVNFAFNADSCHVQGVLVSNDSLYSFENLSVSYPVYERFRVDTVKRVDTIQTTKTVTPKLDPMEKAKWFLYGSVSGYLISFIK